MSTEYIKTTKLHMQELDDILLVTSIVAGLSPEMRSERLSLPDAEVILKDLGASPTNEELAAYTKKTMSLMAKKANTLPDPFYHLSDVLQKRHNK